MPGLGLGARRAFLNLRQIGSLFLLLGLTSPASASDSSELKPVWTLSTKSGKPVLLRNDFGSSQTRGYSFPIKTILVREARRTPENRMEVPFVSILPISEKGEPLGELDYMPRGSVSGGPFGDEPIVVLDEIVRAKASRHVSRFNPVALSGVQLQDFRGWRPSRRDGVGALFTTSATLLVRGDLGRVAREIPYPGYEAAFARDADVGAALVLHLARGEREPNGDEPSSLVVFDLDGNVLHESEELPVNRGYSQLYVDRSGDWVIVTQQGEEASIASDQVLLVDVARQVALPLEGMKGGLRYHSEDGHFALIAQCGWGKLQLFDLGVPEHPVRLWEYDIDGVISSAAINRDGSLAAAIVERGAPGHPDEAVILLDRSATVVASMPRYSDSSYGLMFAGDFLLVGLQTAELPAYVQFQSTHRIDAYFVGSLQ